MKQLFLLEDDMSLISGLSFAVKKQGYEIDVARTTLEADTLWENGKYDLAILDVSLPDGSGFDFCKKIRSTSKVPIMFLTAADEETDIIMGLDIGGDDYITKPFKLAIFLSRLNALLRRSENFNTEVTELTSNDISIRLLKGEVYKQGKLLELTASEYKLLCFFMENPDQVLSAEQILGKLWDCNENYIDNNSLTVYIRRLRTKIEDNPGEPKRIVTVRGMGYKWNTVEETGCMMKILANRKIKFLFCSILSCILVFVLISTVLVNLDVRNTVYYIIFCSVCMGAAILLFCYGYFKEQHKIMENAISQITEYISGNKEVTIECNDEGELYRLFHEVNSLVAILNAHAENEKSAKKFLRNTISDISHQLKTPLAALNIYNGIIQGEAKELPTIQEFSQLSEQELDRIETLVQSLLKITKLDAGTIILEKSLENVSELAKNIKKHFLFRAEQEGKEICLSGNEEIKLLCDRNWIIEAISNLVKNALDHTEKGGLIRIEWRAFTSIVQISVKDNGSGIHPDDLYHIFKRFYRSRFSKDTQGIGLGLSLTKAIVEAHNGTIEVDSTVGMGTSFTINFLNPTKL